MYYSQGNKVVKREDTWKSMEVDMDKTVAFNPIEFDVCKVVVERGKNYVIAVLWCYVYII